MNCIFLSLAPKHTIRSHGTTAVLWRGGAAATRAAGVGSHRHHVAGTGGRLFCQRGVPPVAGDGLQRSPGGAGARGAPGLPHPAAAHADAALASKLASGASSLCSETSTGESILLL